MKYTVYLLGRTVQPEESIKYSAVFTKPKIIIKGLKYNLRPIF